MRGILRSNELITEDRVVFEESADCYSLIRDVDSKDLSLACQFIYILGHFNSVKCPLPQVFVLVCDMLVSRLHKQDSVL